MRLSLRRIVGLASFPGVIAHEAAHLFACALTGTRVFDYRLFQLRDPPGYVVHARARSASAGAAIALAPFLFNTLVGAGLAYAPALALLTKQGWGWPQAAAFWLGASAALNAFPSGADAQGMWEAAGSARFGALKRLLVAPAFGLVHLLGWGRRWWLDAAYAALVCLGPAAAQLAAQGGLSR
ncbi:MAG: DUF3267 domain-containing protein [Rhizobiales bacterium]|nr:DUF3267 domain-containing protein [Hyphomicrobiales bacterium]